jgi:hypothetical protein
MECPALLEESLFRQCPPGQKARSQCLRSPYSDEKIQFNRGYFVLTGSVLACKTGIDSRFVVCVTMNRWLITEN